MHKAQHIGGHQGRGGLCVLATLRGKGRLSAQTSGGNGQINRHDGFDLPDPSGGCLGVTQIESSGRNRGTGGAAGVCHRRKPVSITAIQRKVPPLRRKMQRQGPPKPAAGPRHQNMGRLRPV